MSEEHSTNRNTGTYTAERLIALEDSHGELARILFEMLTGGSSDPYKASCEILKAKKIRKEAGL